MTTAIDPVVGILTTICLTFILVVCSSYFLSRVGFTFLGTSGLALLFGIVLGAILSWCAGDKIQDASTFKPSVFFDVLLPPIILEAGFDMSRKSFFQQFHPIISTAIAGTAITMAFVYVCMKGLGQAGVIEDVEWTALIKYSAFISAIDPVATLSVFKKLSVPDVLYNTLLSESILNDGIAVVLFVSVEHLVEGDEFSYSIILEAMKNLVFTCSGSVLVSVVVALTGAFVVRQSFMAAMMHEPPMVISLVFMFSLLAYYVSSLLSFSGIVSVFFCGMLTSHYTFQNLEQETKVSLLHFIHTTAYMAEQATFIYMGAAISLAYAEDWTALGDLDWKWVVVSVVVVFFSRVANIFPLISVANLSRRSSNTLVKPIPFNYQVAMFFGGLRGAIAFALCSMIDGPYKQLIMVATTVDVLFTNIVLGGLSPHVLQWLNIPMGKTEQEMMEVLDSPALDGEDDADKVGSPASFISISKAFGLDDTPTSSYEPHFEDVSRTPSPDSRLEIWWKRVESKYMMRWFGYGTPPPPRESIAAQNCVLSP